MKRMISLWFLLFLMKAVIGQSNMDNMSILKNAVFIHCGNEQGIGIVISVENGKAYIITAYHVIENSNNDSLPLSDKNIIVSSFDKAHKWIGTILAFDSDRDIACITIDWSGFKYYNEMHFPNFVEQPKKKGTPMVIIGKPRDKEVIKFFEGNEFMAIKNEMKFTIKDNDGEISNGCSGGPVLDENSSFFGMVLKVEKNQVICLRIESVVAFLEDFNIGSLFFIKRISTPPNLELHTPSSIAPGTIIPRDPEPSKFRLINKETQKYLSSNGNSAAQHEGGWGCQFFYLENTRGKQFVIHCNPNNCLIDNSTKDGGPVNFGPCNSNDENQQWRINEENGLIMIQNVKTNRFLTPSHAGETLHLNGTLMEAWKDLKSNAQKWQRINQ